MKLRDYITIAALLALICVAYAFMQNADAEAVERDQAAWSAKVDR